MVIARVTPSPLRPRPSLWNLAACSALASLSIACGSVDSRRSDIHEIRDRAPCGLELDNPGADPWDIHLDGAHRGSIAPGGRFDIPHLRRGLVAPGAIVDLVLVPGTHQLEVRMEGLDARTEHSVTLRPNQIAEWVWGDQ